MQTTVNAFRLSPQQNELWLNQPGDSACCAQAEILLEGQLNAPDLKKAIQQVINRHEILRTTFHRQPGLRVPFQVIADNPLAPIWDELDFSNLPLAQHDALVEEARAAEQAQVFDLEHGPLLRARLLRLSASAHLLLLSLPALIADAKSLSNLVEEISRCYASAKQNDDLDEPVQYVQFSEWQNELLEGEEAAEGKEYWRNQNLSTLDLSTLPFAYSHHDAPAFIARRHNISLPSSLHSQLREAARAQEVSEEEFLLACWLLLLSRHTGSTGSLLLGVHSEGRDYQELQSAIGLYSRLLPVKLEASAGERFSLMLSRTAQALRDARHWQDYFSTELWGDEERGATEGGAAPSERWTASFAYELRPAQMVSGGLSWRLRRSELWNEATALGLRCLINNTATPEQSTDKDEQLGELELQWDYDASRIEPLMVSSIGEQFEALLRSAVKGLDQQSDRLDVVGADQRRRLQIEWNQTTQEYEGAHLCIHDLIAQQAARTPDQIAVVSEEETLSYGELNSRANQLARHLRSRGVGAETPVAVMLERSTELVVALLGVLKAGGAYLPLDPAYPQQRLQWMLEDTAAPVVITDSELAGRLDVGTAHRLLIDEEWQQIAQQNAEEVEWAVSNEQLAYIIYTSGSTGRPKGVMVSHQSLVNYTFAASARLDLSPHFSFATVSTFAADLGHTMLFPSLCSGGTLHLISTDRGGDAASLADYCRHHQVDCLKIVPSHLWALIAGGGEQAEALLPLKRLVLGGEASSWELVERVRELSRGRCRIYNHYGPTETTVGAIAQRVDEKERRRGEGVGLGRGMGNMRVYVVDEGMRVAGIGIAGELYIGGRGVARGYFKRPELTAERFIPDPFSADEGARLYRTGDLARLLPDGEVEFIGRVDNQVKFHGFRVELNEIRSALNQHSQIRDSVVRVLNDKNGNAVLVAYYVSRQELEVTQLRELLAKSILEETIPNVFVYLKRLPLTLNGKIDYNALPSLEEIRQTIKRTIVEPRTPTERQLAAMWSEVLGIGPISIEDNFFELGGHSLLATRVITRIRETFKVDLPLRAIFEEPTIAAIALAITQMQASAQDDEEMALMVAEIKRLSGDVELGVLDGGVQVG